MTRWDRSTRFFNDGSHDLGGCHNIRSMWGGELDGGVCSISVCVRLFATKERIGREESVSNVKINLTSIKQLKITQHKSYVPVYCLDDFFPLSIYWPCCDFFALRFLISAFFDS